MQTPVAITIIAGFLGAGKTTLLNRLLQDAGGVRYGVLINDFAAINIDASLIQEAGPSRIALTNGCVCCTLRDDLLVSALELLRSEPRPEHILIECSGVSDPRAVAMALTGELAGGAFTIDTILSLVDAANAFELDYDDTERVIDQAAASDLVLLNKCDIADPERIDELELLLREAQPSMRIARAIAAQVPRELIASAAASRIGAKPQPDHPHSHHDTFTSRAWTSAAPISIAAFEAALQALSPSIYRAKGIVHFKEHIGMRAVFQMVGRRSQLSFEPETKDTNSSSLVAIGRCSGFDASAFDRLFGAPDPSSTIANAGQLAKTGLSNVNWGAHP